MISFLVLSAVAVLSLFGCRSFSSAVAISPLRLGESLGHPIGGMSLDCPPYAFPVGLCYTENFQEGVLTLPTNSPSISFVGNNTFLSVVEPQLALEYRTTVPLFGHDLAFFNSTNYNLVTDYSWFYEAPSGENEYQTPAHSSLEIIGISRVSETPSLLSWTPVSSGTIQLLKLLFEFVRILAEIVCRVLIHMELFFKYCYLNSAFAEGIRVRTYKHFRQYYPYWMVFAFVGLFKPVLAMNLMLCGWYTVNILTAFYFAYTTTSWLSIWLIWSTFPNSIRFLRGESFSDSSIDVVWRCFSALVYSLFFWLSLRDIAKLARLLKKICYEPDAPKSVEVEVQSGHSPLWESRFRDWLVCVHNSTADQFWTRLHEYFYFQMHRDPEFDPSDLRLPYLPRVLRSLFYDWCRATHGQNQMPAIFNHYVANLDWNAIKYEKSWWEIDVASTIELQSLELKIDDVSAQRLESVNYDYQWKEEHYLFPNGRYKGVRVPDWLQDMSLATARGLVLNVSKCGYLPRSQYEAGEAKEIQAQCKFALKYPNYDAIRDVLLRIYKADNGAMFETRQLPKRWLQDSNRVRMNFPPKLVENDLMRRKLVMQPAMPVSLENALHSWINEAPYHKQMWRFKIKSMIKSMKDKTDDEIIQVISKRIEVPKAGNLLPGSWNGAEWAIPYIHPSFMYIEVFDVLRYQTLVKQSLVSLRNDLLNYVREYLIIRSLGEHERKAIAARRIALFIERMRTPSAQRRLIEFGKEHVVDQLYYDACRDVRTSVIRDPVVRRAQHVKRAHVRRIRAKERDLKHMMQTAVETQSATMFREFMIGVSIPFGFLFAILVVVQISKIVNQFFAFLNRLVEKLSIVQDSLNNTTTALNGATAAMTRVSTSPQVESVTEVLNTASRVTGMMDSIKRFLIEEDAVLPDWIKIKLQGLKSAIHFLVHLYRGEKQAAIGRLTDFIALEPEVVKRSILTLVNGIDFGAFARYARQPETTVLYRGRRINMTPELYQTMLARFDEGTLTDEYLDTIANPVELQAGVPDYIAGLATLVASLKIPGMTSQDVYQANQQFTFVNNCSKGAKTSAEFLSHIISMLCRQIFAWDPFSPQYCQFMNRVIEIVRFVNETELKRSTIPADLDLMRAIMEKNAEAQALLMNPLLLSIPSYTVTRLRDRCRV